MSRFELFFRSGFSDRENVPLDTPPTGRSCPKGHSEFTPGAAGRKRNNKALVECLGTHKHHSHLPIIIKAMPGRLLNLHNTVPTLLLPLSITARMRGWGPLLCSLSPSPLSFFLPLIVSCVYLLKHKRLIPHCFYPSCSADMNFHRMMKHRVS